MPHGVVTFISAILNFPAQGPRVTLSLLPGLLCEQCKVDRESELSPAFPGGKSQCQTHLTPRFSHVPMCSHLSLPGSLILDLAPTWAVGLTRHSHSAPAVQKLLTLPGSFLTASVLLSTPGFFLISIPHHQVGRFLKHTPMVPLAWSHPAAGSPCPWDGCTPRLTSKVFRWSPHMESSLLPQHVPPVSASR